MPHHHRLTSSSNNVASDTLAILSVHFFVPTYQATYHRSSIRWSKHSPARKVYCDARPDGSDRGAGGDHCCYRCFRHYCRCADTADWAEVLGADFCSAAMSGPTTMPDGGER